MNDHPPLKESITIELLLDWAYRRELVHRACADASVMLRRRAPMLGGMTDSTEDLGMTVDSSRNLGFEAPADAYLVEAAVMRLEPFARRLVRECAIAGGRPDWTPNPVITVVPGKFYELKDPTTKAKSGKPILIRWCGVSFIGDLPEHVAARRGVYSAWAYGVADVHGQLRGTLARYELTGGVPDPEPWLKLY